MLSSNYREPTPAQRAALLEEARRAPRGSGLAAVAAAVEGYGPGRAPDLSPAERRAAAEAAEADNDRPNTVFVPNGRVGRLVGANELQQQPDAAANKSTDGWEEAIAKINARRDSPIRDFS